jgi:hypothetical protein
VSATIVRRDDLDVFDSAPAVTVLVLESCIRQLDVSVLIGQPVLLSPSGDCLLTLFPRLSTLMTNPVLRLQEPLIVALQFFFENDSTDEISAVSKAVRRPHIRGEDSGIVGELTRLPHAHVELLATGCCS